MEFWSEYHFPFLLYWSFETIKVRSMLLLVTWTIDMLEAEGLEYLLNERISVYNRATAGMIAVANVICILFLLHTLGQHNIPMLFSHMRSSSILRHHD